MIFVVRLFKIYIQNIIHQLSHMNNTETIAYLLKEELVPNFNLLDHEVQKQIIIILQILSAGATRQSLFAILKMGVLEQTLLLRSHIWKIFLGTINLEPQTWRNTKQGNNELYKTLIDKFFSGYIDEDDLLGIGTTPFDQSLWSQIQLDTKRTHSMINFYQKQADIKMFISKPTKNSDIMSRMLYIWGRINPTVKYVQGMNQILAPFFFLEFQNPTKYSQSQAFFMFASLMTFLIDMHIKDMDHSDSGIMGRMKSLNHMLKVVDYEIWAKFQSQKIVPEYYSFRWLALLLGQQFGLFETMRLWDYLLYHQGYNRLFFLNCCCISILKYRKQLILEHDFIQILPSIQKLRDVNITKIIEIATKIYEKYSKININEIYQRITKEIQLRKEEEKEPAIEKKWGYNYGQVLSKTGNFLSKFIKISKNNQQK